MANEKEVKRKLKQLDKFLLDKYKEKFSFKRKIQEIMKRNF